MQVSQNLQLNLAATATKYKLTPRISRTHQPLLCPALCSSQPMGTFDWITSTCKWIQMILKYIRSLANPRLPPELDRKKFRQRYESYRLGQVLQVVIYRAWNVLLRKTVDSCDMICQFTTFQYKKWCQFTELTPFSRWTRLQLFGLEKENIIFFDKQEIGKCT